MDALEALYARRSVRRYQDVPVEREKLEEILKAAMAAPSACNKQPWEFVVVDEPERMEAVRACMPYGKFNAPAAIIVCGNLEREVRVYPNARDFWIEDTSAAMQCALTAATALQLGSIWLGVYPVESIVRELSEVLELPKTVVPMGVALIGYADEQIPKRSQYNEHYVHWQKW
ncbi:MAG: nitroreductase family protein [Christensenellales bacterium]|jgi:nitroreductase